jgi:hypothetical protein
MGDDTELLLQLKFHEKGALILDSRLVSYN